jgi:hypothetical protein
MMGGSNRALGRVLGRIDDEVGMLTTVGQYIGGKVISALLLVSSAAAVIWFWNHPEQLALIWRTIKYVLVWLGIVAVLPWATFFVTRWVVTRDSNRAAALMLLGYTLVDAATAFVLAGGVRGLGLLSWFVLILGFLSAAVYNFKVCEYQANLLEEG